MVRGMLKPEDLVPEVVADAEISLTSISPKFFRIIKEMEPFGPGNMRPVFLARSLKHKYPPRKVGGKHLKMALTSDGMVMDAIAFNFGERYSEASGASEMSLAFTLDENEYNGRVSLQMKVKGFSV